MAEASMNSLFQPPWARGSDDEYIIRLRRSMASLDRHRKWYVATYALLILTVGWIYAKVVEVIFDAVPNIPFALGGFVMGAVIGLSCGWMISAMLHAMSSSVSGFRSERLLLKYHDAIGHFVSTEDDRDHIEHTSDDSDERDNH